MVYINDVRTSNTNYKPISSGIVALFVGGTSGVGKGTLKQLAKYASDPTLYIVGRSQSSAAPLLKELQTLNSHATINFIETEISLIRNVDKVSEELKEKETKIDLLFLSTGYLTLEGRKETIEGIDTLSSLSYYARLRLVHCLLPLLVAAPSPRVISVLAGGRERGFDVDDLEMRRNLTVVQRICTAATQTTLVFEELAKFHPTITFCHMHPGYVNTGQLDRFMQTASGVWTVPALVARWTIVPILGLFGRTVEEAGEWGVFIATSAMYLPALPKDAENVGVSLPRGVGVANASIVIDGRGNGVYRLDKFGDGVTNEFDSVLADYRVDEMGKRVWEGTLAVWDRALERAG